MPIATFLSYSTKDKDTAREVKRSLDFCGFEVFLAHEHLKVSEEWAKQIMQQLKRCKVFVALLTKNFSKSPWANQEVGVALARKVIIAPIKVNVKPPGFLARYQYVLMKGNDTRWVNEACSSVASSVAAKHPELTGDIRKALVASVRMADSYYAGGAILSALERIGDLTTKQINAVVREARHNSQVYNAYLALSPLRNLIREHRAAIDAVELRALHRVWPHTDE